MNSAIERILGLRVADVMRRDVVQVPASATMREAAAALAANDVTGAPVVDEQGRCVGVISGTDFVDRERLRCLVERLEPYHALTECEQGLLVDSVCEDRVRQHMSEDIWVVSPQGTLIEAARRMCEGHVHRLVVLDADRRPSGIISALDVVAALVAAIEE